MAARNKVIGALLSMSIAASGCSTQTEPEAGDEPFSLGGKADDATCPASSTMCWSGDDIEVAKAMLELKDDVLFGYEPKKALTSLVEHANYLEHKLTDEQLEALDEIEAMTAQLPEGDFELPPVELDENGELKTELPPGHYRDGITVLTQLEEDVIGDMMGAYVAANLVSLGQFSEGAINGKSDDADVGEEQDFSDVDGLTPDMERSLQLMYDSGVIGAAMVTMYRATGVLDHDYEVINAQNFGEVIDEDGHIRPSGLTREAKVKHIIRKYVAASAAVGAGAGVVALVPIAGTALAITGETFLLLKLHAQMAFEIGAVYGWDIREGDNLYLLSMMLMGEGLATEAADIFISNFIVPMISKRIAARFGVTLGAEVAQNLANRSIGLLVQFFSRKAQTEIAEAALEGTARSIGRTILGWATLGAAVLISAGLDAAATYYLGRSMETMSKQWLTDVSMEATTYLADERARDCAFRGMAAMAWRDGQISEEEKNLFVAFLAKPYAQDEQTWFNLGESEVVRQGAMVSAWTEVDSQADTQECLEDEFQGSNAADRVNLLAHLYSMMLIDGRSQDPERALYDDYRDGLDGDGWFDGDAVDLQELEYVERALYLTANPAIVIGETAPEHQDLANEMLTRDVFEFLAEPNEAVRAQFDCGFDGGC